MNQSYLQILQSFLLYFLSIDIWQVLKKLSLFFLFEILFLRLVYFLTGRKLSIYSLTYIGLWQIKYSINPGLELKIQKIGVSFHRPTVSRPGWFSVYIVKPQLRVNITDYYNYRFQTVAEEKINHSKNNNEASRTKIFESKLFKIAIRMIYNITARYIDLSIYNSVIDVDDFGKLILGEFVTKLDLRSKKLPSDSILGTFDDAGDVLESDKTIPINLDVLMSNFIFKPDPTLIEGIYLDQASYEIESSEWEIINKCLIEIRGFISINDISLHNLSFNTRVGRVSIKVDSLLALLSTFQEYRKKNRKIHKVESQAETSNHDDNKYNILLLNFFSKVTKETDFKIQSLSISRIPPSLLHYRSSAPIDTYLRSIKYYFSINLTDLTYGARKLNTHSPAFKIHFPSNTKAHQSLLNITSFRIGFGTREENMTEIVYIPMINFAGKTNLFYELLQAFSELLRGEEPPTHISSTMRMSLHVTSPSVDISSHHVSLFIAYLTNPPIDYEDGIVEDVVNEDVVNEDADKNQSKSSLKQLINQKIKSFINYLPGLEMNFLVDDPGARILIENGNGQEMVITHCGYFNCKITAKQLEDINLDHSLTYTLKASLEMKNNEISYRTSDGRTHPIYGGNWVSFNVNTRLTKEAVAHVVITGDVNSLYCNIIQKDLLRGLHKLSNDISLGRSNRMKRKSVSQVNAPKISSSSDKEKQSKKANTIYIPPWLSAVCINGGNVSLTVGGESVFEYINHEGVDIGLIPRGIKLALEDWNFWYINPSAHNPEIEDLREILSQKVNSAEFLESKFNEQNRGYVFINGLKGYTVQEESDNDATFLNIPVSVALFDLIFDRSRVSLFVKEVSATYSINLHYLMVFVAHVIRSVVIPDEECALSPSTPSAPSKSGSQNLDIHIVINSILLNLNLPDNRKALLETNNFQINKSRHDFNISIKRVWLYVASPTVDNSWCILGTIKMFEFNLENGTENDQKFIIDTNIISITLPHQYVLYELIDSIATTFKVIKFLTLSYKESHFMLPMEPEVEKPKQLPKVQVKTKSFAFCLEDDPFEVELGLIFETGLIEQKLRYEKELLFESKSTATLDAHKRKMPSNHSNESTVDGSLPRPSTDKPELERGNSTCSFSFVKDPYITKRKTFPIHHHHHHHDKHNSNVSSVNSKSEYPVVSINDAKDTIEIARQRLLKNFSRSWIIRIRAARRAYHKAVDEHLNTIFIGSNETTVASLKSQVIATTDYAYLMELHMKNVDFLLDKPKFHMEELADYMYRLGKGIPKDTEYSLLLPMHITWGFDDFNLSIRNFPLPLMHFPDFDENQKEANKEKLPAISFSGHFIIAEQMITGPQSIRRVFVPFVPSSKLADKDSAFAVRVARTLSPVKIFTDMVVDIRSSKPTLITWGVSLQPTISAVMQIFDSFSKPPLDPSDKIGFWDKIRLMLHARFRFNIDKGNLFLSLKGSRSPYELIGEASGFVMCWTNGVTILINEDDNSKELLVIKSKDYLLGIPNHSAIKKTFQTHSDYSTDFLGNNFTEEYFEKIVMKLSGTVKWTMGFLFERSIDGSRDNRGHDFRPHYDIELCNPNAVEDPDYDAYNGFRSDYLHMAISVISPLERTWVGNNKPAKDSYNTIHLTPVSFTHFFAWWSLFFSGTFSLPSRTGPLFQTAETVSQKTPKKFGKHLFSVKYQLLLSPLFISHIYKHSSSEQVSKHDKIAFTGPKAKISNFTVDFHQRRQLVTIKDPVSGSGKKAWQMKMNEGEINVVDADIRMVTAKFNEKSPEALLASQLGNASSDNGSSSNSTSSISHSTGSYPVKPLIGKFKITDNEFNWIDLDDFVEINTSKTNLNGKDPKIEIFPLLHTPRLSYTRNIEQEGGLEHKPFGDEPSHDCLIGLNHPETTQHDLASKRITEIEDQLKTNETMLESLKNDLEKFPNELPIKARIQNVNRENESLHRRMKIVTKIIDNLKTSEQMYVYDQASDDNLHQNTFKDLQVIPKSSIPEDGNLKEPDTEEPRCIIDEGEDEHFLDVGTNLTTTDTKLTLMSSFYEMQEATRSRTDLTFNNQILIHNMVLKWDNKLRNTVYKYAHKISDRKAFVYFMKHEAVSFIQQLMGRQNSSTASDSSEGIDYTLKNSFRSGKSASSFTSSTLNEFDKSEKQVGNMSSGEECLRNFDETLREVYSQSEKPVDSFLIKLISPQIQLISETDEESSLLITSHNMELQIVSVNIDDDSYEFTESSLIETRYGMILRDAHFFVLNKESFLRKDLNMFCSTNYGCSPGTMWPPWLALELCYDSSVLKEALVVEKTSIALRYDKPSPIYIENFKHSSEGNDIDYKCNDVINSRTYHANQMTVDFPKVVITCDSKQYYTLYFIVLDLLMYSDPQHKLKQDQLKRLVLATDFRDLEGTDIKVKSIQSQIRILNDLSNCLYSGMLSLKDQKYRMEIEAEKQRLSLEIFFMLKGIKAGANQISDDELDNLDELKWLIRADQIIWHLLDDERAPLLDIALADSSFRRVEKSGGANANVVEVGMMQWVDLTEGSIYPELLSPYKIENFREGEPIIKVSWSMLEPIGGIPIMDDFDVKLLPLKIQVTKETAKNIIQYLFQDNDKQESASESEDDNSSDDDDDDNDDSEASLVPVVHSSSSRGNISSETDVEEISTTSTESHKRANSISSKGSGSFQESRNHRNLLRYLNEPRKGGSTHSSLQSQQHSLRRTASVFTPNTKYKSTLDKHSDRKTEIKDQEQDDDGDDMTQMMTRASKFLTIIKFEVHSVEVCISFKSHGSMSIANIHELDLLLPTFSYENKTWSTMDMVNALKRDIRKSLLQHAGHIIGHKLKVHRPSIIKVPLKSITNYVSFMSLQDLKASSSGKYTDEKKKRKDSSRRSSINTTPSKSHRNNMITPKFLLNDGANTCTSKTSNSPKSSIFTTNSSSSSKNIK